MCCSFVEQTIRKINKTSTVMLPFYIILANMGFLGGETEPERSTSSSNPRAINNSIYSVHNYKRPYIGLVERNKRGVDVNSLAARPTSYKRQRSAEQPVGSVSFVYVPTADDATRNYKQQNRVRPVESLAKKQQPADLISVVQKAP